ncbi:MAG TPA: outer membrane beta-barrel protein [Candidatus Acidoferrum sp.]|jgi:opacity protein-like surface antigen|nr:outer membrane beta-barrel protein [Candidatus Acidoferrum sp.]
MKINSSVVTRTALTLVSASLLLGAAGARAGDNGFYVSADAGVAVPDGDLTADLLGNSTVGSTSLNAGARVDLLMGYAFGLSDKFSLGPELEVGYVYNSFDKGSSNGRSASGGGDVNQVPVLANVVLNYHITPRLSTYVGAGPGIEYLNVNVSNGSPLSIMASKEGSLAFDAKIGIQYQLGPGDLGLSYQYLGVAPVLTYANFGEHCITASYTLHF